MLVQILWYGMEFIRSSRKGAIYLSNVRPLARYLIHLSVSPLSYSDEYYGR